MLADVPRANPLDGRCRGRACALGLGLGLIGSTGCIREPLPEVCPNVDVGELVISELRGNPATGSKLADYIEIYNAAGKSVDLQGLIIRVIATGGTDIIIREPLEVDAGAYVVIASGRPSWITYDVGTDAVEQFLPGEETAIELEACGEVIDTINYAPGGAPTGLPEGQTLACGNADAPPTADDNDDVDSGCWCLAPVAGSAGEPNQCP
jgi:hypothetical protein